MNQSLSNKFANMSLACAMLVVTIHCGFEAQSDAIVWFMHRYLHVGVAKIAVPFFFLASGYFLAAHVEEKGWWRREVLKRVKTVLLPFVICSLFYVLATAPISIMSDIQAGRAFGASLPLLNGNLAAVLGVSLENPVYVYHLWFLRNLFVLCLLSLALVRIVRKAGPWFSIVLFAIAVAFRCISFGESCLAYRIFNLWIGLLPLAFFSFGLWLRMKKIDLIGYNCAKSGGGGNDF